MYDHHQHPHYPPPPPGYGYGQPHYPPPPHHYGHYGHYYRPRWYHYFLPDPSQMDAETKRMWRNRLIKAVVAIVLTGLLVVGLVGYYAYNFFASGKAVEVTQSVVEPAKMVGSQYRDIAKAATEQSQGVQNTPAADTAPAPEDGKGATDQDVAVKIIDASTEVATAAIKAGLAD